LPKWLPDDRSPELKQKWGDYCDKQSGGYRDPYRSQEFAVSYFSMKLIPQKECAADDWQMMINYLAISLCVIAVHARSIAL
jgi:hypothetical protein